MCPHGVDGRYDDIGEPHTGVHHVLWHPIHPTYPLDLGGERRERREEGGGRRRREERGERGRRREEGGGRREEEREEAERLI